MSKTLINFRCPDDVIDTFDETRRKQRVALKEKMWWAERGAKDRDLLKTNLLVAGPAAKIDGYNKWITTYMSNYDVDAATARNAFVANLVAIFAPIPAGTPICINASVILPAAF